MCRIHLILGLAVAAGGLLTLAPAAEAGSPYGCGHGYGGYLNRSGYSDLAIPYFAQFPPVYYSYPVPRPYGWSPYAYPPTVMTPHVEQEARPATIINPHVEPNGEALPVEPQSAGEPDQTAARPQVIVNPYVVGEEYVTTQ